MQTQEQRGTIDPILDYLATDHVTKDARYYHVGRLIRQDLTGPEPGYRDTLECPACALPLRVMGPSLDYMPNRYEAQCNQHVGVQKIWRGLTLDDLWQVVNSDPIDPTELPNES